MLVCFACLLSYSAAAVCTDVRVVGIEATSAVAGKLATGSSRRSTVVDGSVDVQTENVRRQAYHPCVREDETQLLTMLEAHQVHLASFPHSAQVAYLKGQLRTALTRHKFGLRPGKLD